MRKSEQIKRLRAERDRLAVQLRDANDELALHRSTAERFREKEQRA